MKIGIRLGLEIRITDLLPGEVFQTSDRAVYIRIAEMTVTSKEGFPTKVNAINLENGAPSFFGDCSTLFFPATELVIG